MTKIVKLNFYISRTWKKARDYKIASAGYPCEVCGEIGEIVHHIILLSEVNMHDSHVSVGDDNL